ncbi:general stress protein [Paenibacillus sp. GSMTC-2017]|uniref:general stress protein n=1 Tax=Paenibacillus sp. GSMTC-2017 TaxID=2794350 RepID=UPI0018D5D52E|nr:general stress protein [Paenibacillus sp. GSMTC-2017]MBH5319947.1 general stress protein [Paenibacillus sp. GSMTC-2017]
MTTTNTTVTKVHTVMTSDEVQKQVMQFRREGYIEDRIFVLTHDKTRTKRIAERTDAEQIGISEEGLGTAIANLFRSTGDELRAKMRSLGISKEEADRLEGEMDHDRIVVIAWGGREYLEDDYDRDIYFHPYMMFHHGQPPIK